MANSHLTHCRNCGNIGDFVKPVHMSRRRFFRVDGIDYPLTICKRCTDAIRAIPEAEYLKFLNPNLVSCQYCGTVINLATSSPGTYRKTAKLEIYTCFTCSEQRVEAQRECVRAYAAEHPRSHRNKIIMCVQCLRECSLNCYPVQSGRRSTQCFVCHGKNTKKRLLEKYGDACLDPNFVVFELHAQISPPTLAEVDTFTMEDYVRRYPYYSNRDGMSKPVLTNREQWQEVDTREEAYQVFQQQIALGDNGALKHYQVSLPLLMRLYRKEQRELGRVEVANRMAVVVRDPTI